MVNKNRLSQVEPDFPHPDTEGEPFYALVEVLNGNPTGFMESHTHNGKAIPVLFVFKDLAEKTKEARGQRYSNYYPAGVKRIWLEEHLLQTVDEFLLVMAGDGNKGAFIIVKSQYALDVIKSRS